MQWDEHVPEFAEGSQPPPGLPRHPGQLTLRCLRALPSRAATPRAARGAGEGKGRKEGCWRGPVRDAACPSRRVGGLALRDSQPLTSSGSVRAGYVCVSGCTWKQAGEEWGETAW